MDAVRSLSHTVWNCTYHVVWMWSEIELDSGATAPAMLARVGKTPL